MNTDIRYRIEWHNYTLWQRFRLWLRNVMYAIRETPDYKYARYIQLHPGDSGYDTAPWRASVIEHPARYTFEGGKYVAVQSEEPD